MALKHKTPLLDELEKGPWPSFVTDIKRMAEKKPDSMKLIVNTRLFTNYIVNVILVTILIGFWGPMWLLFASNNSFIILISWARLIRAILNGKVNTSTL